MPVVDDCGEKVDSTGLIDIILYAFLPNRPLDCTHADLCSDPWCGEKRKAPRSSAKIIIDKVFMMISPQERQELEVRDLRLERASPY
jgi:hypothetical protein